ncbi:LysR family transcriptional regulator [Chelativorans sp. AA-79]|uniref:LysR family transcriptional regulator n=1 Tax=Chelativorans sp. AA-79 TaxID=3028735 RepID=UPI0023F6CB29|nr:LysR family transcriptional regulator [Chelativorans sp. AA-79]WEX09646.1 LysR family transcriptional regulator [Chelativorans sp. AA-79]
MFAHLNPTIDVRLLRTLHLLLSERNVSRVAVFLGQTQPAVSQSLKKARNVFGDPLLVRSGHMLVLTERGEEVRRAIEMVLGGLSEALLPASTFDPRTAQTRIRIAAVNCFGIFLIPAIGERIRREAPQIAVDFFAPSPNSDLQQELGAGRVDIVIGNWPAPTPSLRHSALLHCGIACVARADHSFLGPGPIPLEAYLGFDHVSPTPGTSAAFSPIDGRLYQLGVQRRIAMSVPEYSLIPAVLAETDLLFTTARPYAERIIAASPPGQLRLIEAPAEFGEMNLYMLWHERAHFSAHNRWLRGLVKSAAKRFDLALHSAEIAGTLRGRMTQPLETARS